MFEKYDEMVLSDGLIEHHDGLHASARGYGSDDGNVAGIKVPFVDCLIPVLDLVIKLWNSVLGKITSSK